MAGVFVMSDKVLSEMVNDCMISRTRVIARVLSSVYDEVLRPYDIGSAQFALLVAVFNLKSASRAEIGRFTHQERSTLTRNIKLLLDGGWIEESASDEGGRRRPIVLTKTGKQLLHDVYPAWQTAQERARNLLGEGGVATVMGVGNEMFYGQ
ncbi:MarR family winged helix-turn-helix transcriptional regulator [Pseudomonas sp. NPDC090208]|uniref:MarR family winged helix-turn-helix transcriptional regulator n=1 Tax=Pseudomonas sp. NPDC090208 TaxID=3364478 RepID=UPI0038184CB3